MMAERKVTVETAGASKYRVTVGECKTMTITRSLPVQNLSNGTVEVRLLSSSDQGTSFVDRFTKTTANAQNAGTRLTPSLEEQPLGTVTFAVGLVVRNFHCASRERKLRRLDWRST
jgi:hypothetical protein